MCQVVNAKPASLVCVQHIEAVPDVLLLESARGPCIAGVSVKQDTVSLTFDATSLYLKSYGFVVANKSL